MKRKQRNHQESHTSSLLLDTFIAPIYRVPRTLISKDLYKRFRQNTGLFVMDCIALFLMLVFCGFAGSWHFFSSQLYIFWIFGAAILGILYLSIWIGKLRRRHVVTEPEKEIPQPAKVNNSGEVVSYLMQLGYKLKEAKEALRYVEANFPHGTTEIKVQEALKYFGAKTN